MSIFYNRVERINPQDKTAPKKWYATLKTIRQVREKEVAKLVADETTMDRKEVEMALDRFEQILIRLLLDGHSVQLGDWGSFYLTCNSAASDTKAEVTASNIKNLNIRFSPGVELTDALKHATFIAAETLVSTPTK
ncbi:MAG: HU family DNA-binding protein [Prevotellaceae bacterium]|jgi:predicted histone-like DNA-binding protein|nr:HU family DNA-binding protein [Prevotellaceae bacterium]